MALTIALITSIARAESHEPVKVDKVWIRFPATCKVPDLIFVVVNGKDDEVFKAKHIEKHDAWTGYWRKKDAQQTFDAWSAKASVRLGGARTDCRQAGTPMKDPTEPNTDVATFEFECNSERARDVGLSRNPPFNISYVRRSKKSEAAGLPCEEDGIYKGAPIADVRVKGEEIRLQLGEPTPKKRVLGTKIDFNVLKQHGTMEKATLHLDKKGMKAALAHFAALGDASVPTLSGVAIDINDKALDHLDFNSLDLTVTP